MTKKARVQANVPIDHVQPECARRTGADAMNDTPHNLSLDPLPSIETLLIFAGPPGSGKTTLAEGLIDGARHEWLGLPLPDPVTRTEIQTMRRRDYPGGTLVVEFSTLGIDVAATVAEIERLIGAARYSAVVTIRIDRFAIVRQYARRMRHEQLRRTPEWLRYLRFGKLKQLAIYLLSGRVERGYHTWGEVLGRLSRDTDTRFLKITSVYGEPGHYRTLSDKESRSA